MTSLKIKYYRAYDFNSFNYYNFFNYKNAPLLAALRNILFLS